MTHEVGLKQFIYEHYNVLWSHPESEGVWDTFLLAEEHDNHEVRKINGLFVSRFATEESPLFVEGESSELKFSNEEYLNLFYPSESPPSGPIFGWDIDIGQTQTIFQVSFDLLAKARQALETHRPMLSVIEELKQDFTMLARSLKEIPKTEAIRIEIAASCATYNHIITFLEKEIIPLEKEQDMESLIENKIYTLGYQQDKYITQTFQRRTLAMVHTLETAATRFKDTLKFLVAGALHLKERFHTDRYFTHHYSLDPLYHYLNLHGQHTVILIPQKIDIPFAPSNHFFYKHFLAIQIQKTFRNYLSRKRLVIEENESQAASRIQKAYHHYVGKKPKEDEIYIPHDNCAIYYAQFQIEDLHQIFKQHLTFLQEKGINFSNYYEIPAIPEHCSERIKAGIQFAIQDWQVSKSLPYYRTTPKDLEILTKLSPEDFAQINIMVEALLASLSHLMNCAIRSNALSEPVDSYAKICYIRTMDFSISKLIFHSNVDKNYKTIFATANTLNSCFLQSLTHSLLDIMKIESLLSSTNPLKFSLRTESDLIVFF